MDETDGWMDDDDVVVMKIEINRFGAAVLLFSQRRRAAETIDRKISTIPWHVGDSVLPHWIFGWYGDSMTKELEEEKILSASQATIYEVVISLSKQNGDRHYKSIFYTLPTLDVHNFYQQSDTGNLYTGPRKNCPDWGTAPREIHGKSKRCRSSQNSHETTMVCLTTSHVSFWCWGCQNEELIFKENYWEKSFQGIIMILGCYKDSWL